MDVNYDYYRVFYHVAKLGNFTQAAHTLMRNQPNITRTIKNLEHSLDCTLFIRSNRGVRLTPEGEALFAHIRIAVEQIQAGEKAIAMDNSLQSGTVTIAASEVALRCFLLPVLQTYRERYPRVRLKVSNHTTPQAIATLKNGLADLALATTPVGTEPTLYVENVKEIREIAVCGTAFSELTKQPIPLEALAKYPIISLGTQTKTYALYAQWFLQNGLAFAPDIEAATADQILPLVQSWRGLRAAGIFDGNRQPHRFADTVECARAYPPCLLFEVHRQTVERRREGIGAYDSGCRKIKRKKYLIFVNPHAKIYNRFKKIQHHKRSDKE